MRDHFFLGRVGILRKQRGCLHDLPGLAVAALRHLLGNPGLLQRMITLGGKAFDGGDLLADRIAHLRLTGAHGFAIDVNRASTAQTSTAAELGAGHLQLLADDPQQRRIIGRFDGHIPSINIEIRHFSPLPALRPLTAAAHFWVTWYLPASTGFGCRLSRSMIPIPFRGNAIWNWSKENNFRAALCVAARRPPCLHQARKAWAPS